MEVAIRARNISVPPLVRAYLLKKFRPIERKLSRIPVLEASVELARERARSADQRVVAQATLNCNGTLIRAEERASDLRTAIDAVLQVLDRRVRTFKERLYKSEQVRKRGRRQSIRRTGEALSPEGEAEGPLRGRLVRVKRFPLKPMSLEEAVTQMELLGHSFFLFLNSDTDRFSLVYKRKDGDYGLIEPAPE